MPIYYIGVQGEVSMVIVNDKDTIVEGGPMLGWTVGYEWKHVRRYFEQYAFMIKTEQESYDIDGNGMEH